MSDIDARSFTFVNMRLRQKRRFFFASERKASAFVLGPMRWTGREIEFVVLPITSLSQSTWSCDYIWAALASSCVTQQPISLAYSYVFITSVNNWRLALITSNFAFARNIYQGLSNYAFALNVGLSNFAFAQNVGLSNFASVRNIRTP